MAFSVPSKQENIMNESSKKIAKLCAHRLHYFKLEGKYAKLRREVEMRITEEHLKALDSAGASNDRRASGDSYGASIKHDYVAFGEYRTFYIAPGKVLNIGH